MSLSSNSVVCFFLYPGVLTYLQDRMPKKRAPIQVFDLIKQDYSSPQDTACSQLIEGALFFGMRSCDYVKTPGYMKKRTTLLELRDISFYNDKSVLIPHDSTYLFSEALTVKITYRKKKNKENCQEVSLKKSPNRSLFCRRLLQDSHKSSVIPRFKR